MRSIFVEFIGPGVCLKVAAGAIHAETASRPRVIITD